MNNRKNAFDDLYVGDCLQESSEFSNFFEFSDFFEFSEFSEFLEFSEFSEFSEISEFSEFFVFKYIYTYILRPQMEDVFHSRHSMKILVLI